MIFGHDFWRMMMDDKYLLMDMHKISINVGKNSTSHFAVTRIVFIVTHHPTMQKKSDDKFDLTETLHLRTRTILV